MSEEDSSMYERKTALIVDDDERIADLVACMLRAEGFEVRTAQNGMQGYSSYFRNPTDWIITDVQMPELDGVEMVRCIRAINPCVKVLYMSGAVDAYRSPLDHEAQQYSAKVLLKPFSKQRLLEQL
jgi:two-component system cell cycle sensor histidine kinase/response regulator CckA